MKKSILLLIAAVFLLLSGCGQTVYQTNDVTAYDKAFLVGNWHADLGSDLSLFPDELPAAAESVTYSALLTVNLFDIDATIILDCVLDEETFDSEIARLSGLSKVIRDRGETYTNRVIYDETSYRAPAYITIDGFGNTYEYALLDRAGHEITYLYLSYPYPDTFPYPDYLKRDLSVYEEENTLHAWSMYNHSFDGDRTWVEFDD